jgi:hypothetical protein
MKNDSIVEILDQYSESLKWDSNQNWNNLYNSISNLNTEFDEKVKIKYLFLKLFFSDKKSFEFKFISLLLKVVLTPNQYKTLIELLLQIGFRRSALLILCYRARPVRDFLSLFILLLSFNKIAKFVLTRRGNCYLLKPCHSEPKLIPRSNSQTKMKIWDGENKTIYLPDSFINFDFVKQEFRNCKVTGTGLVIKNRTLFLLDRGANPTKGFVSGTWPYLTASNLNTSICDLRNLEKIQFDIGFGYDLLGRNAANYFHSLIEYLPKILFSVDSKSTLIINSEYPNAIKQAISILNEMNCSVIEIDRKHVVNVRRLTSQSLPTSFYDSLAIPHLKSMSFNIESLNSIRDLLLRRVGKPLFSNKLILDRDQNTARSAKNFESLVSRLEDSSFQLIKMHELNLLEQINAFHFADTIVGVGGAHFANLIFSKPNQQVFCITSEGPAFWPGFQQLCAIFGLEFTGIMGKLQNLHFDSALDKYHGNFIVPDDSYSFIMDSIYK